MANAAEIRGRSSGSVLRYAWLAHPRRSLAEKGLHLSCKTQISFFKCVGSGRRISHRRFPGRRKTRRWPVSEVIEKRLDLVCGHQARAGRNHLASVACTPIHPPCDDEEKPAPSVSMSVSGSSRVRMARSVVRRRDLPLPTAQSQQRKWRSRTVPVKQLLMWISRCGVRRSSLAGNVPGTAPPIHCQPCCAARRRTRASASGRRPAERGRRVLPRLPAPTGVRGRGKTIRHGGLPKRQGRSSRRPPATRIQASRGSP